MEHIEKICSLESELFLIAICSIRILNALEVIAKTSFSKTEKFSTLELEALLDSPDQRPKHTRVENWLNQSLDDLDEKESSIDSFQSLNEDIRTLRDENHKVGSVTIVFNKCFISWSQL